ncbi:MAG: tRNA pseudouridine(38-40) synthase TruA [Lachnospiraceae bacterium]|nr:tRNA pseudouridine(38-40) synthase TruA [Lachnospiraceae bacterium]
MRNFRMILQYEGSKYQGWQKQDSTDNTIQGKLENILSKMTGIPVEVHGAGRTDAGVHAKGQVDHFKADTTMSETQILNYLNQYLPEDIELISLKEAGERFHARLNAIGKIYQYRIVNSEIPHVFERRYVHVVKKPLDITKMKKAADILKGTHDFKAFTSTKRGKKSTVRTIENIDIKKNGDEIVMTYKGDGFLYHMVRILSGTLIEVGLSERSVESVKEALESLDRKNAGILAPAKGLTLIEVLYH